MFRKKSLEQVFFFLQKTFIPKSTASSLQLIHLQRVELFRPGFATNFYRNCDQQNVPWSTLETVAKLSIMPILHNCSPQCLSLQMPLKIIIHANVCRKSAPRSVHDLQINVNMLHKSNCLWLDSSLEISWLRIKLQYKWNRWEWILKN